MYGYSLVLSSSHHTDKYKCIDKLEGASLTIILDSPKQDGDALIWKCDDKVIYERKRGKESTFPANVNNNGSLILTNLIPSMSCTYKAEHHDKVGKLMKKVTERLCVLPRAPVPTLVVKCSPTGVGTLHCGSQSITGFKLSWIHNNKDINEKSNPFQPKQHGEKDHYKCRLANSLDKQDSNEVTISCKASGPGPEPSDFKLLYNNKWMMAILVGAGILLLVLTVSLVLVSCKNHRLQNRKPDNEELRLTHLQDISTGPPPLKQTPEDRGRIQTQEVVPDPSASQPDTQPPPPPAEKDPATPVPQPRKKLNLIPKTQDCANSDSI
ncbi:uncharacterized protein LOC116218214 isoform X2 [Clupea harengus]|uniref:Uncharacterized protein LOC116218214 isoform X2 n=1 Tax=Clupea harengus TaxID=7950 RepID=A0A6P8ERT1_CLUHA|nr:uncharacterized protein LOC116218214 isoform X2 [Clupea harengus]